MSSDIFNRLPPEIHIYIVNYLKTIADRLLLYEISFPNCDSPGSTRSFASCALLADIRSFTSASPTARRYFYANQCASFVRPYIQEISVILEDESLIPLAVVLLQARKIRARTRGLTSPQIEQSIRPCLDAFARSENSEPDEEWKEDLGCITTLIGMKQHFDDILRDYAWRSGVRSRFPPVPYRHKFINHFLRYDLYCQLGCHGEEKLFAENEHIKELESHIYKLILPESQTDIFGPINMIGWIKKQLEVIISLFSCEIQDRRREINQVDDVIRQGGPSDFVMQRLRECRFKSRNEYDTKIFLDHAWTQGYPFILYLQEHTREAQAQKTFIDMFFKMTTEKSQKKAGMSGSTRSATRLENAYRSHAFS